MAMAVVPRKAIEKDRAYRQERDRQCAGSPQKRQQQRVDYRLLHDAGAGSSQGDLYSDAQLLRRGTRHQHIRYVGTRDQQNEHGEHHEHLQALRIESAHSGNSAACGNDLDVLPGQRCTLAIKDWLLV
jgi:hypothetical protein